MALFSACINGLLPRVLFIIMPDISCQISGFVVVNSSPILQWSGCVDVFHA